MNLVLRNIRQLVTVASHGRPYKAAEAMRELHILTNASVIIRDGKFSWIGHDSDFPHNDVHDFDVLDASEYIVLPGFVDVLSFPFFPHNLELRTTRYEPWRTSWVPEDASHIFAEANKVLTQTSKQEIKKAARGRFDTMLRLGTTTATAIVGGTNNEQNDLLLFQIARELVNEHLLDIHLVFPLMPGLENSHIDPSVFQWLTNRFLPYIRQRGYTSELLIEIGGVPENALHTLLSAITELNFSNVFLTDFLYKKNNVWIAAREGTTRCMLASQPSDDDILLIRQKGAIPFVVPAFTFYNQQTAFSLRGAIQAGLPLALGTASHPAFVHTLSMQNVLTLACAEFGLTPEEALTAATLNSAAALGVSHSIGSIECGKQADALLSPAEDYRDLIYSTGINAVSKIIKNGVLLDF